MKYALSSVLALILLLGTAADALAQGRSDRGRSGRNADEPRVVDERQDDQRRGRTQRRSPRADDRDERRERDDEWFEWGNDEQYERRGRGARKGEGPAFCRSGAGHPVHGRSWCVEKGWGLGHDRYRRDERARGWEDIIFRRVPRSERDGRLILRERSLEDILGRGVLARLDAVRRTLGFQAPLEGRWRRGQSGGRILQVAAGDVPLARLTDVDHDGRVDRLRVRRP